MSANKKWDWVLQKVEFRDPSILRNIFLNISSWKTVLCNAGWVTTEITKILSADDPFLVLLHENGDPFEWSHLHFFIKALEQHLYRLEVELGGSSLLFCKDVCVYSDVLEKSAGLSWEEEQADSTEDLEYYSCYLQRM